MNHTVTKHANGTETHTWESAGFQFELDITEPLFPPFNFYILIVKAPANVPNDWQRTDIPDQTKGEWYKDGIFVDADEFAMGILFEAHEAIAALLGEDAYPIAKWADPFIQDWEAWFDLWSCE